MPVETYQIPGGARVLIFTCCCGAPAHFGVDSDVRAALRTGDVTKAGTWFCGMDATGEPACVARVPA